MKLAWSGVALLAAICPAAAQDIPTIDTEDASLGSASVGDGGFHPVLAADLRNGDFARGAYDDDDADLDRLPLHLQLGFAWDLRRNAEGKADTFLLFTSSNGFHAPVRDERTAPRAWYESNNALALVTSLTKDLRAGLAYTIKTSPNGVSATTHELSLTTVAAGKTGLGALQPGVAITWRPQGGGGLFTQLSVEPSIALSPREDSPELSFPARIGVGWSGFYQAGSANRTYGSMGAAYSHPFSAGGAKWRLRAEMLAIVRDTALRRLGDAGTSHMVVPLATLSLQLAY
ncbi:hypothetical protein [uncultured Sphingomonas sp.]|uniref:hypothetical protein n=1 Tax=uncultured Sphingomonas sp. TaxID=158754 RepID=UPI0025E1E228|nr:hypothetical protein [uncultured Sphingomonas sp.]